MILIGWHPTRVQWRTDYYPVGWECLADHIIPGYYILTMVLQQDGQRFGLAGLDGEVIEADRAYADDGDYFPFYANRYHGLERDDRLIEWWNIYRRLDAVHAEMVREYTAGMLAGAAIVASLCEGKEPLTSLAWKPVERFLADPPLLPGQSRRWWTR